MLELMVSFEWPTWTVKLRHGTVGPAYSAESLSAVRAISEGASLLTKRYKDSRSYLKTFQKMDWVDFGHVLHYVVMIVIGLVFTTRRLRALFLD